MSNVNLITKEPFMPPEGAPPSAWPLAEQALDENPAYRAYWAEREAVLALEKPPSVTVESGIRAAFDQQAGTLARGYDADRVLVAGWYAEAWGTTFQRPAPVPAPVPEPLPEGAGDAMAAFVPMAERTADDQAQDTAQAALDRWAPGARLPEEGSEEEAPEPVQEAVPAEPQGVAEDPAATQVIPAVAAETEVVERVPDGGEQA